MIQDANLDVKNYIQINDEGLATAVCNSCDSKKDVMKYYTRK